MTADGALGIAIREWCEAHNETIRLMRDTGSAWKRAEDRFTRAGIELHRLAGIPEERRP